MTTTEKAKTRNIVRSPASNFSVLNAPGCGGGGLTDLFTRITFGSSAKSGQFPWLAALVYRNSRGSGVPLCGAALVSTQHLITAAHCTGAQAGFRLASAILGQTDLAAKVSLPGLEVDIARVVSHPEFAQDPVAVNDLAVVKLVRPVSLTDHIRPICLYQPPESEFPAAEEFTVAGWGRTERARSSSVLQYTHLQGVTAEVCSVQYSRAGARGQLGPLSELIIRESQICAQGDEGTDSCSGDSGGPLMRQVRCHNCWRKINMFGFQVGAKWFLTGVVSFGTNECDSSLPGVYTSIKHFHDWILKTMISI